MGNASTKESRGGNAGNRGHHSGIGPGLEPAAGPSSQPDRMSSRRNRVSRGDLGGILGLASAGGSSSHSQPQERRETKQEREARRLERERIARIAERERSMKEEHVDGGFLVTMGTYTGPEDFNKQIVRQLQIERKLAPFWRGLNDFSDQWTEPQIIAAARGLPVPPADQTPPEELIPRPLSPSLQGEPTPNLDCLTVPIGSRSQSTASDHAVSNPASALPSPATSQPPRTSSPFKPRGKAIASVFSGNSRNGSTTEFVPNEINLPHDPFVNGQPIEVFLYKNASDCPICFLSYPPYLNHTRCCDQPICSECFVQIKRPDPHFPEGHNENDPNHNPEEAAGLLVSEPACCPYCTQPDFGVTYEPPPFRRGLTYTISPAMLGSTSTAMSSSSSVNSALSPALSSPGSGRRRNQSLSANSPNVILTDRIRPEWATKLQAARAHQARRAAAATALHTAAFIMGNADNRAFRSRFSRRNTGGSGSAGASPGGINNGDTENGDSGSGTPSQTGADQQRGGPGRGVGSGGGGSRRSRLEDLEDMMFMEAVRLSLAAEEERKRKVEKEEKKEAKKREKEERKAAKAAGKQGGPYEATSSRSGHSSASASSLSLPGLSFGRKRGNSAASNLRIEASVAGAMATGGSPNSESNAKDKGKGVDRAVSMAGDTAQAAASDPANSASHSASSGPRSIPTPHLPAGPSHLRQMSNASSVSSSVLDSQPGSFTSPSPVHDARGSGLTLGSRSGASEDSGDQDRDRDPSASTEPMFNYRSLAEVVGVSLEGESAGRRLSQIEAERETKERAEDPQSQQGAESGDGGTSRAVGVGDSIVGEPFDNVSASQPSSAEPGNSEGDQQDVQQSAAPTASNILSPPTVTVTPDTTEEMGVDEESKQFGHDAVVERAQQVAQ
ncbi:SNF1-interacting protein [Madurella fahalii]|uniref:SNF1-interacting protein n=1 Tax=Madurella fahalii TaxID=1157608 RepID=A0ABQ0GEK2_9PEZI